MRKAALICGVLAGVFAASIFGARPTVAAAAAGAGWETQYTRAVAASKKSGKAILANFTGSDWCPYCIKLEGEVFSSAEFKKWAVDNVILLEVDFPRTKQQPADLKKQNEELQAKYGITGYPTVLFINAEGKKLGQSGYTGASPAGWIAQVAPFVPAVVKPEPLKVLSGFADAMSAAKQQQKALLVIAYDDKSSVKARVDAILASDAFAELAPSRYAVVHVNTDAAAGGDDAKALSDFREAHKIAAPAVQFIAIDPQASAPLAVIGGVPGAAALSAKLKAALSAAPAGVGAKPAAAPRTDKTDKNDKISYDGAWLDDLAKARAVAQQTGRPVLLDFTGSDWCGWCMKLDSEVFSTDEFKAFAKKSLVLVTVDFPHGKKLSPEVTAQNEKLSAEFKIEGFPTIVVIDAAGKKLGELGYQPGGPGAFIAELKKLKP